MSMKGLPEFLWLDADRLVEQSWSDVLKGKAVSVPGWQYKLLIFIVQTVPRSIVRKVGMNMRSKQRR
jgi:short-subunit dehydrogenase